MSFNLQNEGLGDVRSTEKFIGQFSPKSPINENEKPKYHEKCAAKDNEKRKEQNVRVKDIRSMLANDQLEAKEKACLNTGQKCLAVGNSVCLNKATSINSNKSSINCDLLSFNGNEVDGTVLTDVKLEMDDKCSIDEDNFKLCISDDDEGEIPEIKFDSKFERSTAGDECSQLRFSSTDLENAAISDTINNNDDEKVERLINGTATVEMPSAIDDCTSNSRQSVYGCVWCMKQFPARKKLTFHVLSHLRGLKQDNIDGYLASSSEVDSATLDDSNANASVYLTCAFCEVSFANKRAVIKHYISSHRQSDSQLQSRTKRTALNGPYWQSCENKIPDTTIVPIISRPTEESSTILKNDESGFNEDASKQYKCYICNKQYARYSKLRCHFRSHEKYKYPKLEKNTCESDLSSSVVVDTDGATHDDSSTCISDVYTCNAPQRNNEEAPSLNQQASGHKCESCGKFFSTSSNMRKHARNICQRPPSLPENEEDDENDSEDSPEEFACTICDRSFCSQRAVSIHAANKHRYELSDTATNDTILDGPIPCDSYTENEEGVFQCSVCGRMFESRKGVIRHIGYHRSAMNGSINDSDKIDEKEENIPCPPRANTFGSIGALRMHANKHTEKTESEEKTDENSSDGKIESSFECPICSKTFESARSYSIHIGWHSRRHETAVTLKKKTVRSETVITPQKKSDISEAVALPQKKSDVRETEVTPVKKLDNSASSTSASPKLYQCRYCPRSSTTQQGLAGHMRMHQALKTATSQEPDQPRLKAHHSSEMAGSQGSHQPQVSQPKNSKLYTCQVCSQKFSSNLDFSEHMKLHITEATPTTSSGQLLTLEDTMECGICSKSFMHKQDMAKHMRHHINGTITKEKVDPSSFRCIHCPKSFVGRKSLNTHQRLHEEAQVALKRAANELLADVSPAKQRCPSDPTASALDSSVVQRHARMTHGLDTVLTNETTRAIGIPSTQQEDHCRIQDEMLDEGPQTVVVNDLEALGEHAVVQCVDGGNEEYFVFEQREGEAFQCSECDETHFDKMQMIVHMAYHVSKRWANGRQRSLIIKMDPIMLAPFECMFCDERFVSKKFRCRHLVKRHGDDVMQCTSCSKLFLNKKRLAAHCQRHFSDPVYRCERCLKCFTSRWFLKRHTRKSCIDESAQEIKEEQILPTSDVESANDE